MAKLTIRKDNVEYALEDISMDEVKELIGLNGHRHPQRTVLKAAPVGEVATITRSAIAPDFEGFYLALSDRGRKFIDTLRFSPQGIDAYDMAPLLDYQDPRQIGGLTGGGLAKIAKRFHIKLEDVYRTEVTFPDNKRKLTFYPGKWIGGENKKPA